MVFKKISESATVARFIAERLNGALRQNRKVLWLVPGGSAIAIAAQAAAALNSAGLPRLTVTLTDERYGAPGHPDSNWRQLEKAGFSLPAARLIPVLKGQDLPATARTWAVELEEVLRACDYKLGFFGMGADGHTAGILPDSPAVTTRELTCAYDGGTYQRITVTEQAIIRLDEAVVYATGEAKWPVLDRLETDLDVATQPAQILKRVPKLTIFNDHKGEVV